MKQKLPIHEEWPDSIYSIRFTAAFLVFSALLSCAAFTAANNPPARNSDSTRCTWIADNGNGTFTNPLFYEEFSDPDMIRVGDDYYMTGTTMHTMPGLPVLHSKDLVNWELLSYAVDRLDLGPELRLENGLDYYGQGIWAPCFRYHNDTFYIFSNANNQSLSPLKSHGCPHGK